MRIGGVTFESREELDERVREQLAGGRSWTDRRYGRALDGLAGALREGPHRQELAESLLRHLIDPEPSVRTGVVALAGELASIAGADRLARILERHDELFWKVAPQGHELDLDLGWEILVAIADAVGPDDQRALEVLRANSAGRYGYLILPALARHDPDWFVDNASAMVPPVAVPDLLGQLEGAERRAALVRAVPWSPLTATAALAHPAWQTLALPSDELEALRAFIERAR